MEESINTENQAPDLSEADAFRRNVSGIIDAAITIFSFTGVAFLLPQSIFNSIWASVYILFSLALYRLISIVFFKQTLGMRLCNIQLLNQYDDKLSIKEGIFASFFILINGITYYKLNSK